MSRRIPNPYAVRFLGYVNDRKIFCRADKSNTKTVVFFKGNKTDIVSVIISSAMENIAYIDKAKSGNGLVLVIDNPFYDRVQFTKDIINGDIIASILDVSLFV